MSVAAGTRVNSIDALRGIAAMAVMFRHFTYPLETFREIGFYGDQGIIVFFVISGFILPYSLAQRNYRAKHYPRFILKRIIRLDPPYIIAAIFAWTLLYLNGREVPGPAAMAAHIGYLNDILKLPWASGVFWTLAIEFQFYLFLGLTYETFLRRNNAFFIFLIVVLVVRFWFSNSIFLLYWLPFFSCGMLLYKFRTKDINLLFFAIALLAHLVTISLNFAIPQLIAVMFAILFMLFLKINPERLVDKIILKIGVMSYSLYLFHLEFGKIARFIFTVAGIPLNDTFLLLSQISLAMVGSYIFYKLFEKPFARIASEIRYKQQLPYNG